MLKMYLALIGLLMSVMVACSSFATPTSVVNGLAWDTYTDPEGVGFYIYWRRDVAGSTYSNTNRFQVIGSTITNQLISSVLPTVHPANVCFVLTAYNAAGSESGYSNEVCGFTGFRSPSGVRGN